MAPLSKEYISSAKKALNNKLDTYTKQLNNLKKSNKNHNAIKNTIISFIISKVLTKLNSSETDDLAKGVEEYVDSFVSGVFSVPGPGPEGSMSMANIGMILLGGVLATDKKGFFGLVAYGADNTSAITAKRAALLRDIKDTLYKIRDICTSIDPKWYNKSFVKRVESAISDLDGYDVNVSIVSSKADDYVLDRANYSAIISKISSAIVDLGDRGNFTTLGNLNNLIDLLVEQVQELSSLSNAVLDGLSGLSTSMFHFAINSKVISPITFELIKQTVESAGRVIKDIQSSMKNTVSHGINSTIPMMVHTWVTGLSSCREMLETGLIDVAAHVTDSNNSDTIILNDLISSLRSIGSPVDVMVEVLLKKVLDYVVTVLVNQQNADKVISLIGKVIPLLEGDMGLSGTVFSAIESSALVRDNATIGMLVDFLPNIGQDKLMDMIKGNDWKGIVDATSNNTTYEGEQALAAEGDTTIDENNLIEDIKNETSKSNNAVKSYSELKDMSVIILEKYKIPEVKKLLARLSEVEADA